MNKKHQWAQPDNPEADVELICGACVSRVRDAFNFKQQLLVVDEKLAEHFEQVIRTETVKEEETDDKSEITIEVQIDSNIRKSIVKSEFQEEVSEGCDISDKYESDNQDQPKLSEDEIKEEQPKKKNRLSKKKKREEIRVVKNYRPIDIDEAVSCVLQGTLTQAQAAAKYGVPRTTIYEKVRKIKNEEECLSTKQIAKEKCEEDTIKVRINNLIKEIMKILTYTNATPFKTTTSSYGCVYCNFVLKATTFEDQEILRAHTRVEHANERIRTVEMFMKPYTMNNEVLKVDIHNLVCTVCCEAITGWLEMFEHLKEAHDEALDEAYTRVIPYIVDVSSCKCAICKEKFNNYHHLDSHMNCHYNNYVCDECGETFLSHARIKAHKKIHRTGVYPCDYPGCGKVFNLKKYKKKHYLSIHTDEKIVKCQYCELKFHDEVEKHNHIKKRHKEKVRCINCDLCGMVFDWKTSYYTHMRKKHKSDEPIQCQYCDVTFENRVLLRIHLRTHGHLTNYCDLCDKTYSSRRYLKQHRSSVHGRRNGTRR